MSIIGNNILNEIVQQQNIREPAKIVSYMDKGIEEMLRKEYADNVDGMDLIMCRIRYNNNKATISYCGANRPLVYYSQKSKELVVDKGWCKTFGDVLLSYKDFKYTSRTIELDKGDMLYLFSDGFPNQINSHSKRYGSKRFNKVLKSIAKLKLEEQKKILEDEFIKFTIEAEQYDDVAVWGIKL